MKCTINAQESKIWAKIKKHAKMPVNHEYLKRNSREGLKSNKSDSTTMSCADEF